MTSGKAGLYKLKKSISLKKKIMNDSFIPPWKALLSAVFLAVTLYVNYLANALPLNGQNTGEVSGKFPNDFVPAGLTFGIWGLIYLFLLIFTGLLLFYAFRKVEVSPVLNEILPWFWLSCLMNGAWIFAFHYEFWIISLMIMLALLLSLLKVYILSGDAGKTIPLIVRLSFSIYLGWISVATLANVTLLLVSGGHRLSFLPEYVWSTILMTLASGLGIFFVKAKGDLAYGLVIAWALFGIQFGQKDTVLVPDFARYAFLLMILVVLWEGWQKLREFNLIGHKQKNKL